MSSTREFAIVSIKSSRVLRLVSLLTLAGWIGGATSCAVAEQVLAALLGVDVSVSQSVSNASPAVGALTSFDIRVRNHGPVEVSDIIGIDSLSSGLTYDSHIITGNGWFDPLTRQWNIGRLGVNQEAGLTIVARTNAGTGGSTQSNVVLVNVVSDVFADTVEANNRRSATVTVGNVVIPPSDFSNEPPGLTTRSNWDWTTHEGGGWRWEGANPTTGAFMNVVNTGYGSAPPVGGPTVLQANFIGGTPGGFGAGRTYFPVDSDELFIGFWHKYEADFRASDNTGGNKIFFLITGPARAYLTYRDRASDVPRRPYGLTMSTYGPTPNVEIESNPVFAIPLGEWYKTEVYFKRNTPGNSDGILRVWFNGVQAFVYSNLVFPAGATNMYFEGTHNGEYVGQTRIIPEDMHWWIARTRVSVRAP